MLEAQKALLAARSQAIQTRRDYIVALIDLEKAVGLPIDRMPSRGADRPMTRLSRRQQSGDFRMTFRTLLLLIAQFLLAIILGGGAGCRRDQPPGRGTRAHAAEAAPSNRVDIPESVRRNLGITFAQVESRPVAQTIRVPGQFELLPEARRGIARCCRAASNCSSDNLSAWNAIRRCIG